MSFISSWPPALRHRSKITLRSRIHPTTHCSHRRGVLTGFCPSGHLLFRFQALQVTFAFLALVDILTSDFSCFRVVATALCVLAYSRPIRMVPQATYATYAPTLWPILGELGGFALLWVTMLTSPIAFAVVSALIRAQCVRVHVPNAFTSFLGLCGSSGCDFGLVPGQFRICQSFWGFLTVSDVFAGLLESLVMPCMHVHVSDESIWLSSLFGSPTHGGKFGLTDGFAGAFELLAILSGMCVRVSDASIWSPGLSGSSMCDTAPLADKSGITDTFPGFLKLVPPSRACMRTLSVPGQGLSSSASSAHVLLLPVGKSKSCIFRVSRTCTDGFLCVCSHIHTVSNAWCMPTRHVWLSPTRRQRPAASGGIGGIFLIVNLSSYSALVLLGFIVTQLTESYL